MNNHQDWAYHSPASQPYPPTYPYTSQQKIASTVVLLIAGYFLLNFYDAWPSTIKRDVYEQFVRLIPGQLIYTTEHTMHRLGRLPYEHPQFEKEHFSNYKAKGEALRRIFGDGNSPVMNVVRKARTLSGLDNVIRPDGEMQPPGLGNWDNSCYQNSVLQGFASLPAFRAFVQQMAECSPEGGVEDATYHALAVFLDNLNDQSDSRRTLWTPTILKSMDSWQQQDAQEYYSRILDEVEKEIVKRYKDQIGKPGLENLRKRKFVDFVNPSQTSEVVDDLIPLAPGSRTKMAESTIATRLAQQSHVSRLERALRTPLDGLLAQGLECTTCGFTEGLSFTQFNCLTVNLGDGGSGMIEELLEEYTAPEEIEGVECTNCTKIALEGQEAEQAKSTEAETPTPRTKSRQKPVLRTKRKQITVGRLPQDLVIHINRSIFDMYGNQRKNTSIVGFPVHLKFLSRWCAQIDSQEIVQRTYELNSVVTHYGRHENGHYIAYGKRGKDWYCFNDEIVTKVDLDEVLGAGNVFMLFYEALVEAADHPTETNIGANMEGSVGAETAPLPRPEHESASTSLTPIREAPAPDQGSLEPTQNLRAAQSTAEPELKPELVNNRSLSLSEESAVMKGHSRSSQELEAVLSRMRTAGPSSHAHQHSSLTSSSVIQAL